MIIMKILLLLPLYFPKKRKTSWRIAKSFIKFFPLPWKIIFRMQRQRMGSQWMKADWDNAMEKNERLCS